MVLLCIGLLGCDPQKVYESDINFEGKIWDMNETPVFAFKLEQTKTVDIIFKLRNDLDYPFQNLYIQYVFKTAEGKELKKDLMNLTLFDTKTGIPTGTGNSIFQNRTVLLSSETLSPGNYEIELAQYMREDKLAGVYSAGIRVEESMGKDN